MKHISEALAEGLAHLQPPAVTLGFDIGLTGAVSAIREDGTAEIFDLPVLQVERRIDASELLVLVRKVVPEGCTALALIEDIRVRTMASHPMAHSTEDSLAKSRGIVQAVLDITRCKTKPVEPMTWKRFYGLVGADKDDALRMARKLYPGLEPMLARKKDHNRAESLLIARFGARTMT